MPLSVFEGDLLCATEQYLMQQCNCISTAPHGLSGAVAAKFPWADPYRRRRKLNGRNCAVPEHRPEPGTVDVFGDGVDKRYVVCMYAQYGMGKPYSYNNAGREWEDSPKLRKEWFAQCLDEVAYLKPTSVAMPHGIGCGLAGGNWAKDYHPVLVKWADENPAIAVVLYKL